MVEEKERMNKQVVEDLMKTVDQKNDMMVASRHQFVVLRDMVHEVNSLRMKAEEEKSTMEGQHKRDLEAVVQAKEADNKRSSAYHRIALGKRLRPLEEHNKRLLAHQTALTKRLKALEGQCEAMKEAEVQMRRKSEAERQRFEREKQDAERLLDEARMQAVLHADLQCKLQDEQKRSMQDEQKRSIQGVSKALEMAVLDQKRKLIERQERELQEQHVKEMLEIKKLNQTDKEKIAELESEQEVLQDLVNVLSQKERTANQGLEDARKVAVQVLVRYGVGERIGNKLVGSIDKKPWAAACQKKFMHHPEGWELVMTKIISEWEDRIGDQGYHPFKNVKLDLEGTN